MTLAELRPVSFSDSFGPIGWSISLVAVLLLHLAFAYYIFVYHRMEVAAPPPPPKAILIDLAPVAPLLGPKIAPMTQPVPCNRSAAFHRTALPAASCRPRRRSILPWRRPRSRSRRHPFPTCRSCPTACFAPRRRPPRRRRPSKKPEVKKPAQTKPVPQKQTEKTKPKPKSQQAQLPVAPSTGAMQKANPITLWQLAVIKRLQPYMRWPDDAPYWIDTAAPHGPDHHRSPGPCPEGLGGQELRLRILRQGRPQDLQAGADPAPAAARDAGRSADLRHGGHLRPVRPRRIGLSGSRREARRLRFFRSPYRAARYRPRNRRTEYP